MSNEQNIFDIVRLLKETVDSPIADDSTEDNIYSAGDQVSEDELHETLKQKFSSENFEAEPEEKSPYDFDNDFLEEFSEIDEEEPAEETTETEEETEVSAQELEEELVEENDEYTEELDVTDTEFAPDIFEDIPEIEPQEQLSLDSEDEVAELFEDDTEDCSDKNEDFEVEVHELEEAPLTVEEIAESVEAEEFIETEKIAEAEETVVVEETAEVEEVEIEEAPIQKNMSFKSMIMDYGKPDPTPGDENEKDMPRDESEDDTPDVGSILSDFATPAKDDVREENRAAREFMSKLGCEDELDDIPMDSLREVLSAYSETTNETAVNSNDEAVINERRERYRKETFISALRAIGCFAMTVILFFYDFLPTVGVKFLGISDYTNYPGAYVLFGTQLLVISAVILWKPMIDGVKKLATLYPNMYSMAAVMVGMNVAYDLIFLISNGYDPFTTPMFHCISSAVLTCVAISALVSDIRRVKAYDIYISDVSKFNLSIDNDRNSIANKMYSGGFSKDKKVYIPTVATSPKGFSKAMSENGGFDSSISSSLVFGAVIMSVIISLIFMIAGMSISEAAAVMMVTVFVLLPIGALLGMTLPYIISVFSLSKRGIALTSRRTVKHYADAKVMVFNDLHIFKKCDPKNVGFVAYDKNCTRDVIAALQILYSRIGGPMATSFDNLSDDMRAKRIRVRRIAKNGIEALVDRKHVLIVGELSFLSRYGVKFPGATSSNEKSGNASIYVSLDGRASAMISAKYEIEPVFDMLIERLSAEGGHCVIETYDPIINTAFVSALRRKGNAPISVVHKNAADINVSVENRQKPRSDNGILAVSSRYKLIEGVVWCNRISKAEKLINVAGYVAAGIGLVIALLLAVLGIIPAEYQFILLAYGVLLFAVSLGITIYCVPGKNYFTVAALCNEQFQEEERQRLRREKEAEKIRRKNER